LPAFLIEFDSMQAAFAYISLAGAALTPFGRIVLISPAAQEYLQPAQPTRDLDRMSPGHLALTLPPWKLLLQSSQEISAVAIQKLAPAEEKGLRRALKKFAREVLERHKNAMIIRFDLAAPNSERMLAAAALIATNYNFINATIAEGSYATFAFVPLSIDPPAAMHYAEVVSQLSSKFGGAGLKVLASPREVTPYLHAPIRGGFWSVIQAIKNTLWRHSG